MRFNISKNIIIEQKYDMFELSNINLLSFEDDPELVTARYFGYNPTRIFIKNTWYEAIPLHILARTKSTDDYYRFIYIQINMRTGEYYIGKVNRKRWRETLRYQGSGLLFKNKYEKHEDEFVRYYIAACDSQEETELLEAEIVDYLLLQDVKCLNLVQGGGGTNNHPTLESKKNKQREYMKAHPEQYRAMVESAKELYCSGNTVQLEQRGKKIKATMSAEKYREMSRERILRWQEDHPEEYALARENNRKAQQSEETKRKKAESLKKWQEEHPAEYEAMRKKSLEALTSEATKQKRANSLKQFYTNNPEKSEEIKRKRTEASVKACRKGVNMIDLETGQIIKFFESQHDAARWLVENGHAPNTNCVSSISAVCLKKTRKSGKYRRKAYGFGWEFSATEEESYDTK